MSIEVVAWSAAVAALVGIGYVHRGDPGVVGREAFFAPDESPPEWLPARRH